MSVRKRLKRFISAFSRLARTERRVEEIQTNLQNLQKEVLEKLDRTLHEQNAWTKGRLAEQSLHNAELTRRLDRIFLDRHLILSKEVQQTSGMPEKCPSDLTSEISEGFKLFLDSFYHRLENQFRGSREDIQNRLRVYQPDVESAVIRTGGKPVLDLGCGRGEWLQLMRTLEIPAVGVDLNTAQIAAARNSGFDVREQDARSALITAQDNSISVISAHHIIEHMPFSDVAWIAREAMRILAPGGILIFETPNPRNIIVGATSFHNDPTHLQPFTDSVLSVLLETVGYHPVETRFLHPHERLDKFLARPGFDPELAHLLFGPQDLAMIGQKPRLIPNETP